MTKLDAKPNPLEVDFKKSAIVVVDMQNAFASRGGMLDIARVDITDAPRVIRVDSIRHRSSPQKRRCDSLPSHGLQARPQR